MTATVPATKWDGIKVYYTPSTGTEVTVGRIKKVPAPTYTAEDIDTTDQDSNGNKEYIPGMKDGSEIELVMNDITSDTGQQALIDDEGNVGAFRFVFPNGRSLEFGAAIKTANIIEDGKAMALSVKCKVSGEVSKGTSPVQLSALGLTTGTLVPDFAVGTYLYTASYAHATASERITPASSSTPDSIKVNGTAIAGGTTYKDVTLADGITTVEVIVKKATYGTTVYKILLSRTKT